MSKWLYAATVPLLMSLSSCIEITTYVSPSASGTVLDAASEKPIQGAAVSLEDHPGLFAQTNADGQFVLEPITRKTHLFVLAPYESLPPSGIVVVSAAGYVSKQVAVRGSDNALRVSLDRATSVRPKPQQERP